MTNQAPSSRGYATNLHTHTWRCHHAVGEAIDYARVAAAAGMRLLGMADHTPLPHLPAGEHGWGEVRMDLAELPGYLAAVAAAAQAVPDLRIVCGLECEPLADYEGFYRDELLGRHRLGYLIAAAHITPTPDGWIDSFSDLESPADLAAYATTCIAAMESGLYALLAHPDIFGCNRETWNEDLAAISRDICAASTATGVPLELNANGLRRHTPGGRHPYPWAPFWEIAAERKSPVVISADAHRPMELLMGHAELTALASGLGLCVVEAEQVLAKIANTAP